MPVPPVFADTAARVHNWGRWGPDDEIGTLNLIDDAARRFYLHFGFEESKGA